jgi:hypothetical protein
MPEEAEACETAKIVGGSVLKVLQKERVMVFPV